MSSSTKSFARLLALASVAAMPVLAFAHGTDGSTAAAPAPVDAAAANLTVVRDAATGQLRAPTAAEAAALQKAPAAATARRPGAPLLTLARTHSSGARGARLTDELMSQSVVVRQPDGSLQTLCFQSHDDAKAAMDGSVVAGHVHNDAPTE